MDKHFCVSKGFPYPLGVTKLDTGVNFAVVIPDGKDCSLTLYEKGKKNPCSRILFSDEYRIGNIGAMRIDLCMEQYEYCLEIDGMQYLDSFAKKICGTAAFGNNPEWTNARCAFLPDYDWEGDENPKLPLQDIVLYRMHVRGFTKHSSAKVKQEKGTFAGIIKKIPYLKELGINQVELMPIYEFQDSFYRENHAVSPLDHSLVCNYWGYGQYNFYFALKENYAHGEDASIEFKDLVKELHRNQIELIMELYFTDFISEEMQANCMRFWKLEYHVDGFHLTGNNRSHTTIAKDPLFANTKIYADGFSFRSIFRKGRLPVYRNLAVYADDYKQQMRCFLKGDTGKTQEAAYYLRRNEDCAGYVNYFTGHDGFTLHDLVSYNEKHNEKNEENNLDGMDYNGSWNCGEEGKTRKLKVLSLRKKQMKNAWMILLCSQGIPAILAGDECCNSQLGNNNAYCQDNEIGWVNWNPIKYYEDMPKFVKALIQFRKEHKILHSAKPMTLNDYEAKGFPDISYHGETAWQIGFRHTDHHLGVMYCGAYEQDGGHGPEEFVFLAYNMKWKPQKFALPRLPSGFQWYTCIYSAESELKTEPRLLEKQSFVELEERSSMILLGKK